MNQPEQAAEFRFTLPVPYRALDCQQLLNALGVVDLLLGHRLGVDRVLWLSFARLST